MQERKSKRKCVHVSMSARDRAMRERKEKETDYSKISTFGSSSDNMTFDACSFVRVDGGTVVD